MTLSAPGNDLFEAAQHITGSRWLSVEGRLGEEGGRELNNYLEAAEIRLESVTPEQVRSARLAWRRYDKSNHPAGLTSVTASHTRSQ